MSHSTTSATPYASGAPVYRTLGWEGILPVDLNGRDGHVPVNRTGHDGVDPTPEEVQRWIETNASNNLGLRVPAYVIGIDVDAYDDKTGDETIRWFAEQHGCGDLPPTWTSTARGPDQPSRIYLYRVPGTDEDGNVRRWRPDLGRGSGVELIQRSHRWARVWPSVNRRLLGRSADPVYRWYDPAGRLSATPPRPDQLTDLAEAGPGWLAVLEPPEGEQRLVVPPSFGDTGRTARSHAGEDVPALDVDGQPVDPKLLLEVGVPIGSQQTELFRYMCSLRARGAHREEMIALGMLVLQRLENDPTREPWTPQDVVELVDHVRRDYAPGATTVLPGAMQRFAERLRAGTLSVDEAPLAEETATDLGNSLRFARLFADRARYVDDVQRWYVWDGRRWQPDAHALLVTDLTKHVIDDVRREALLAEGEDQQRWSAWAHKSESLAARRAMITGAQSEPGIRVPVASDVFDRDPDLLVVRNGTVDLRTGELRESRPEDMNSQLAEVDYDPEARCPRWEEHVRLVTAGDEELARYLARAVGYSLTGDVGQRAFFFLEGRGSNGKNAFIEPIMMLLGSYAHTANPRLITGNEDQHATTLASLLGKRVVFVDEAKKDKTLNTERIKALTGSRMINAEYKHKDPFEFEARFKLWIAGNGRPRMNDESDGVWKRLHRVICRGQVPSGREIEKYSEVLYREEASGILNWALRGLEDWRGRGRRLDVPATVREAVDEHRHDENYVLQFAEDRLEVTGSRDDVITNQLLFDTYVAWCDDMGLHKNDRKNQSHFSRALTALEGYGEDAGIKRDTWYVEGRKMRGFSGLRLQP